MSALYLHDFYIERNTMGDLVTCCKNCAATGYDNTECSGLLRAELDRVTIRERGLMMLVKSQKRTIDRLRRRCTALMESASNPVLRIEIADGWPIPLPAPSESP